MEIKHCQENKHSQKANWRQEDEVRETGIGNDSDKGKETVAQGRMDPLLLVQSKTANWVLGLVICVNAGLTLQASWPLE